MFFSKRAPKQKDGCLDTLDTPLDPPVCTRDHVTYRPRRLWARRSGGGLAVTAAGDSGDGGDGPAAAAAPAAELDGRRDDVDDDDAGTETGRT